MTTVGVSILLLLTVSPAVAQLPRPHDSRDTLTVSATVMEAVLSTEKDPRCSFLLLTDGVTSPNTFRMLKKQLQTPCLFGFFEATEDNKDVDQVIEAAKRLRRNSWHVTVVVVSDDPTFLTSITSKTVRNSLLVAETRLLAVTRLPLSKLWDLQESFALRNAMLILMDETSGSLGCSVYVHLPYRPQGTKALKIASWTPHRGLTLTTQLPLFPDKFTRFLEKPHLVAVSVEFASHNLIVLEDVAAPGGKRITFEGIMETVLKYLSEGLNFTYSYVRPEDGTWGTQNDKGQFSGMMGVMTRGEADIGLGPFALTPIRYGVVDYTYPVDIASMKIMSGRGRAEADPWGFLLPLAPLVWVALLISLSGVLLTFLLLSSYLSPKIFDRRSFKTNASSLIRVLLQQGK
ncbi:glutamate receptor ionotropic, kainate 1-like [Homarus americanus]|uniref:glutamate receptor ionotropic, kainate 1-like n=1 Tax=Homarus americanus TaxID=6706 RepID=UPI001C4474DD|nr:glutamate receptor ionotropic, kainate 1-like [Homarus americanus]